MTWVQRARRCECSVPIDVEDKRGWRRGLTQNLGRGGVFVATEYPARQGERLALRFALPGFSEPLLVEAEVRWVRDTERSKHGRGPGMGLRFAKLSMHAAAAIDAFLRSRTPVE